MTAPARFRPALVLSCALAGAALCAGAAAPPAGAVPRSDPSDRVAAATAVSPGGWHRYHAQAFTAAAGTLCPFTLRSQVLFDGEYVRTTATYGDGSPRIQEFVGPQVVRVTNRVSGRSVMRDLSGRAVVRYHRDGGFDFQMQGPVGVGFHPGDSRPTGYYVLRGEHTVRFSAAGRRTVIVDRGTEENLCHTLRR